MTPAIFPQIYWLFGQPAAGRAELVQALAAHFQSTGRPVTFLNGDELRAGLCEDLGFTEADQWEKVRRGAHVAKKLTAASGPVICSFLTPKKSHRELVRQILGMEVCLIHVQCALHDCKICQGVRLRSAATAPESLSAGPDDFELPAGADTVISTHDRSLAASLQELCQITSTTTGEPVKPAGKWRESAAVSGGVLSAREMEVMSLLSQGLRHKEMAGRLGISVTTVRTHLERACVKLSASSRTEAVARFVALRTHSSP